MILSKNIESSLYFRFVIIIGVMSFPPKVQKWAFPPKMSVCVVKLSIFSEHHSEKNPIYQNIENTLLKFLKIFAGFKKK